MALELDIKPGQTPLDPDEAAGLIPSHISTQGQLDEWEAVNLLRAQAWLSRQRDLDVLNDGFCRELHRRMFNQTWEWAGTFRRSDKNIGCEWLYVGVQLRNLFDDAAYWIEHRVFPVDEIAARFHHKLVSIHPFPNGNGRHARFMTDALLRQCGHAEFTWGCGNLVAMGDVRHQYIEALRAADKGDVTLLCTFVRS